MLTIYLKLDNFAKTLAEQSELQKAERENSENGI